MIMEKFVCETNRTKLMGEIYGHLQDVKSKEIFIARSLYSLCNDNTYMDDMVKNMTISKVLLHEIAGHKNEKKVLFGAGIWGVYYSFV
jgi:hypothetical protein